MKITHYSEFSPINASEIEQAYSGVLMRRVISEQDGAESTLLDIFEIAPDGETPFHSHSWEHQVFVISGIGYCRDSNGERPFRDGDVIYITPNEPHSFHNKGRDPVKLVCIIPKAAIVAYHLDKLDDGQPVL